MANHRSLWVRMWKGTDSSLLWVSCALFDKRRLDGFPCPVLALTLTEASRLGTGQNQTKQEMGGSRKIKIKTGTMKKHWIFFFMNQNKFKLLSNTAACGPEIITISLFFLCNYIICTNLVSSCRGQAALRWWSRWWPGSSSWPRRRNMFITLWWTLNSAKEWVILFTRTPPSQTIFLRW